MSKLNHFSHQLYIPHTQCDATLFAMENSRFFQGAVGFLQKAKGWVGPRGHQPRLLPNCFWKSFSVEEEERHSAIWTTSRSVVIAYKRRPAAVSPGRNPREVSTLGRAHARRIQDLFSKIYIFSNKSVNFKVFFSYKW